MSVELKLPPDEKFSSFTSAVSLSNVSKRYKHFQLSDISFQLETGTVVGLIGPNGAGKSTTMRLMMGLIQPDCGSVTVLGKPISSREAIAKQDIGYFADDMRLYKAESIAWHMQFVRSLFPTWDDAYANQLLDRFGLIGQQIVKGLSHGQRVKAMLLLILARRPKLLILDEPTNGLDPVAKHEVLTELMRVVEDPSRTILFSSHNTQDIHQICDSITFIDRGRVIASCDQEKYLESWRRIKVNAAEDCILPEIDGLRGESTFKTLKVLTCSDFNEQVISSIEASGGHIEAIEEMTLEEIFLCVVLRGREVKEQA